MLDDGQEVQWIVEGSGEYMIACVLSVMLNVMWVCSIGYYYDKEMRGCVLTINVLWMLMLMLVFVFVFEDVKDMRE